MRHYLLAKNNNMKIKQVQQNAERSERQAILQSMKIDIDKRFSWDSQTWVQDEEYELDLIEKDVDFNLKDDLAYIGLIMKNYTSSIPDTEDQRMLEAELSRTKKMYTYKINYLTIRSHLLNIEQKKKTELPRLEKMYTDEINLLKYTPPEPLHFRKRTKAGYIRKMTIKANQWHDQKIIERKKVLEKEKEEAKIRILKEEEDLIKGVIQFLKIDERYIALIKAGVMLLPSDSRLAAIFPKSQWLTFNRSNKVNRHEAMHQHARKLLMKHNLFTGKTKDKTGILPGSRKGCLCIMYIKEGHMKDQNGATFRPVFGASGVRPYGEKHHLQALQIESNSYISMGVPDPSEIADISYEKTVESLSKRVDIMQRLGIKAPSMQSRLYFLQTPEYRANKKINEIQPDMADHLLAQAKKNKIGMLESWGPSNCAEPAIMTAIYQMYSRPADIYLSVPFEGVLSHDKLLLKYTCTRCALSEPAFMSPQGSIPGQRLTDMRLQRGKSPVVSHHLLSAGLIYNAEYTNHPYQDKHDAIERTVIRNQGHGFGHVKRGHDQVAVETTKMLMIRQIVQEIIDDVLDRNDVLI
ncbi:hypothetical protein [Chryseobacterium pennipullorum]|nr:hypothetical protein [Chryseobacterium pennipullorum]